MMKYKLILLPLVLLLAACSGSAPSDFSSEINSPTPVPATLLEGSPQDYALSADLLPASCQANEGIERPNSDVLTARDDGEAYLEATKRISGWQVQFDCAENPRLIVNVVTTFETLEGAAITLSPRWHSQVWDRINSGELEQLANMEGLGDLQIVFQDANGTVGVEFAYHNVYLFLTGTADEGVDNYTFFEDLANRYLQVVKASQ